MKSWVTNTNQLLSRYSNFIFFILLLSTAWFYRYNHTIHNHPKGLHAYRQSDCLSIAINYHQDNLPFGRPSIHNQIGDEGMNGYSAGEFPLIYYTVAQLWKVTGYNVAIYRALSAIILFAGLFCLFKLCAGLFNHQFWAGCLTLFLFASPVIAFYGNNFLPNIYAFSFTLIAWYMFYRYVRLSRVSYLILTFLFFTLAGLLKVSSLITFVVGVLLFIADLLNLFQVRSYKLFKHKWLTVIGIIISIISVYSWYTYANWFNNIHRGNYTFNDLWPIWKMSTDEIRTVAHSFFHFLIFQAYHKVTLLVWLSLSIVFSILLFFHQKGSRLIALIINGVITGCLIYFFFWFHAFGNHDYYLIDLMPVFLVFMIGLGYLLGNYYPNALKNPILKTGIFLFLIANILFCRFNMDVRYYRNSLHINRPHVLFSAFERGIWQSEFDVFWNKLHPYYRVRKMLDEAGVPQQSKIISIPDNSINISLVLAGRKGYNNYTFHEYQGRERIEFFKSLGAEYLVITDPKLREEPYLQEFLINEISSDGKVSIYKL